MNARPLVTVVVAAALGLGAFASNVRPSPKSAAAAAASDALARGQYLVTIMGCNDCHTPWIDTEHGPEPDMTRMLSGHPQDIAITSAPDVGEGPWIGALSATNTAFSGPWGVSFTANLTPDSETGLGKWKAETFIATLRTGRHEGQGRPILPPMPWPMIRNATDDDLRAIFAYLQSIPAIRNRVPQPIDPPQAP